MADLTTSERARLVVDGADLVAGTADIFTSDAAVVVPQNINTDDGLLVFAVAVGVGSADLTVNRNGQSGSVTVNVVADPLVVTLGTPEPK